MIMRLDRLTPDEILKVELGTGVPIVYRLDTNGGVIEKRALIG